MTKIIISQPTVISAFPGTGKSHFVKTNGNDRVLDSDSSTFDKRHFPDNYLVHIQETLASGKSILCSSHAEVREGLVENGIPFLLVYPAITLKDQYLGRYRHRGSPQAFVDMMESKWSEFILGCRQQTGCNHKVLLTGQYLSDAIELYKQPK